MLIWIYFLVVFGIFVYTISKPIVESGPPPPPPLSDLNIDLAGITFTNYDGQSFTRTYNLESGTSFVFTFINVPPSANIIGHIDLSTNSTTPGNNLTESSLIAFENPTIDVTGLTYTSYGSPTTYMIYLNSNDLGTVQNDTKLTLTTVNPIDTVKIHIQTNVAPT